MGDINESAKNFYELPEDFEIKMSEGAVSQKIKNIQSKECEKINKLICLSNEIKSSLEPKQKYLSGEKEKIRLINEEKVKEGNSIIKTLTESVRKIFYTLLYYRFENERDKSMSHLEGSDKDVFEVMTQPSDSKNYY